MRTRLGSTAPICFAAIGGSACYGFVRRSRYGDVVTGQRQLLELGGKGARFDLRLSRARRSIFGSFDPETVMHWGFCTRSIAIGGICLMATLATGLLIEPADAQTQQVGGFNPFDPRWALATPSMFSGFNTGPNMAAGVNQQAYTAPFGSGTVGLFVESNGRSDAAISSNLFGASSAFPTSRQDWFTSLGDSSWRTSVVGSYKSAPDTALNGLYTTASFGVTSFKTNPNFSGLTNFSGGNDSTAFSASAGVGLQLTPQISVEGSVSWTQAPSGTFR
jgi:hypothetical protein